MISRSRGYLPHVEIPDGTYFITFRLYDSIPTPLLIQGKNELDYARSRPRDALKASFFPEHGLERKIESCLGSSHGSCWLKDSRIAEIVGDALGHFHRDRYVLHAWTIMPNHVHVLVSMNHQQEMSRMVHSWKSYTATQANRTPGRSGNFWHREYFDRLIRSPAAVRVLCAICPDESCESGVV